MFNQLSQRLTTVVKKLRGQAVLTESNIQEALREVRIALLEADVALSVVKAFIDDVKQQALGQQVLASLTPGQAMVGVVHRALITLMGEQCSQLNLATVPPAVMLMAGLQGAGKTTTTAKLAKYLKTQQRKKVLVVSCDVYRPAAMEQLEVLAKQIDVNYFSFSGVRQPLDIAVAALDYAKRHLFEVLLIDTAGRLAIDQAMMQEIQLLHQALNPIETLFVVDAMQGQDAVQTAQTFNQALPLTGVILTKLDGDARGGAALSVRHVTGKPIKFVGVGEKLDGLDAFYPERMASRILGMGDVLSLLETVQKSVDMDTANKLAHKVKSGKSFDLEDFRAQIQQMKHMGGIHALLDKLPGEFGALAQGAQNQQGERSMMRIEGMICAMTPQERRKPELIKASRKRRIAKGAGVSVQEVNRLLKQFEQMRRMMKQFSAGGMTKMMRGLKGLLPGR